MNPEQADTLAAGTRREAGRQAAADLMRLRLQALARVPVRVEQLFPTRRRADPEAVLNARGTRIARHWYTEVATAALRSRFGEAVAVPAAGEIDAAGTALRRVLGSRDPDLPLRLAGSLHRTASDDAAGTLISAHAALADTGAVRAAAHVITQPVMSESRAAILEQWYQRCYQEAVDARLGLLPPLHAVTRAEASQVAAVLTAGRPHRIIGADGTPLVNPHGTAMTDVDRRLAAGDSHVVDPPQLTVTNALLRRQVTKSWNSPIATGSERDPHHITWAKAAGVPDTVLTLSWHELPGEHQSHLIAAWLDTHRDQPQPRLAFAAEPPDGPFQPEILTGPPRAAAAAMFNHQLAEAETVTTRQVAAAMYPAQPDSARTAQAHRTQDRPPAQQTTTHHLER